MDDNINLWFKVEQQIANLLVGRLENKQITIDRAQEIAQFVVKSIPNQMTDQQMIEIIPKLDDEFTELSSIVLKNMTEIDNINQPKEINDIRLKIQQYIQDKSQWTQP